MIVCVLVNIFILVGDRINIIITNYFLMFIIFCCILLVGEIIEWTGFAIASQSLSSLAFVVYTFANLYPRAAAVSSLY